MPHHDLSMMPKIQKILPFFGSYHSLVPASFLPMHFSSKELCFKEDGPMLVLETGIRTDSDVGFPSYPTSSSW